ncbi:lipoprotein-releasing system ATP-binding protein LolD [Labrys miyagiensis]|uniref:Lipoprotein-releasing system ATP-binding protein LolD n=1 Tax=Labrys miyagiensis TaxID=346912 RepID=A0ABQ6CR35_9HYPH|nr:ABC transporter ATP-binding protein [Labrys miyagiensis]GLS21179.1 lipoprotein-releasing system ATP-binding protein LolD [Labrys miyagiensis]
MAIADGTPALELIDVHRSYRQGPTELRILQGVNLTVMPGQSVALIAPSGVGKSTLLHTAGLLERPNSGNVVVSGQSTRELNDAGRTKLRRNTIGFVYQFHHLQPEFSALENVILPQMIRGLSRREARQRAEELLTFLGLGQRFGHRPNELSGGEQQRVAIARAVANAPHLILADEPTGNLDPGTSDHVFGTLTALVRASGLAAVIATHNLELASRMDRRVTLREGQIVELD